MALNISKHTTGSSNISGSLVNSISAFGYFTLGFSGSGSPVDTITLKTGNDAAEFSPILTSDSSEQF